MIHLFVLRHGEASFDAPSDDERQLTLKGETDVKRVCTGALESLKEVDDILVSPLVRAQQTARIVCDVIGRPKESLETWPQLQPEEDVFVLVNQLMKFTNREKNIQEKEQAVLLVAHQPLVSRLLISLCELSGEQGGRSFVTSASKYAMGTASLASLSANIVAPSCATLNWIKHPLE